MGRAQSLYLIRQRLVYLKEISASKVAVIQHRSLYLKPYSLPLTLHLRTFCAFTVKKEYGMENVQKHTTAGDTHMKIIGRFIPIQRKHSGMDDERPPSRCFDKPRTTFTKSEEENSSHSWKEFVGSGGKKNRESTNTPDDAPVSTGEDMSQPDHTSAQKPSTSTHTPEADLVDVESPGDTGTAAHGVECDKVGTNLAHSDESSDGEQWYDSE